MSKEIRQSKRSAFQRCFSDPFFAFWVFLVYKTLQTLDVKTASDMGAKLGALLYKVMKKRNHIARRNLEIAFPDKTQAEREEILKKTWRHWGRFFAEMPHGEELFNTARKQGIPYLKDLAEQKQGCFICSAHLGNWEPAVSTAVFDDYYVNPVYRPANNPWIDKIMFQRRKGTLIPKGILGARRIVETIHKGGAVVMLCDQKLREGIEMPFFNKMAKTTPSVATLSLKLKAPILMARCIRADDGLFDMELYPLEIGTIEEGVDPIYHITQKINQEIERWIKETPEQWLWFHRRFDKSEY